MQKPSMLSCKVQVISVKLIDITQDIVSVTPPHLCRTLVTVGALFTQ